MYRFTINCDVCGNTLNLLKQKTPLGEIDVVETFRTKVWDTHILFPHLCKSCARRIDNDLLALKLKHIGA